ncbi:MAG: Flp pilus assembly complex ATPase component TadA [Proteobacteria bacterium]|nr:Flp pilus assembly complex ATPase component TadA [Pseudomonadota bacterium]
MPRLSSLFVGKQQKPGESGSKTDSGASKSKYAILFVDDEPHVLNALKRIFRHENYDIFLAESGEKGLSLLTDQPAQVVVSDFKMPGMNGAEFLKSVKELNPETIRIMLTGYADVNAVMGAINEGAVYKFITKPWNDDDLRLTISLALEQFDLIKENQKLKKDQEHQKKKISQLNKFVSTHRSQIGRMLLKYNKITQEKLDKAIKLQTSTGKILPVILCDAGTTDEKTIISVVQKELGINRVYPAEFPVSKAMVTIVPKEICLKNVLVPLKIDAGKITVAMADPTDYMKVDDLKFISGLQVEPVLATQGEISQKIIDIYGEGTDIDSAMTEFEITDPTESIEIILDEEDADSDLEELMLAKDKPPAIRIVNAIISDALRHEASDVHIEPKTKYVMVRYRINGLLQDKIHIPIAMHPVIVSRIKVMAELDIAERRRPQDGRVTVKTPTKMVDMRLSTLPTINGEKIVLRILDRNASIKDISEIGFNPKQLEMVLTFMSKPQGCLLTTGPTGSGKTSTLYSLMEKNATITKNYTTIEDPVEYFMGQAEQVMIKEKIGLTFPLVLRTLMRQDPDIIMLGEIRDFETAEVAFHAALTGHMVLSTLHTNNSTATITRLRDMGIKPYVISDALTGIIAQRLVRSLCPHCLTDDTPDEKTLKSLGIFPADPDFKPQKGKGCDACNLSGYSKRIGIFEVFAVTEEIKRLIHKDATEAEVRKTAQENGMTTLYEDGIDKVRRGLTSLEEIMRVLGPQITQEYECAFCNAIMKERFRFCPYCSMELSKVCPGCGNTAEPDWKACAYCGKNFIL